MKIVCISDTHMRHNIDIPDGDVLVHAGDFAINASIMDIDVFAEWFGSMPHKHKILVPGNHDWCFQDHEDYSKGIVSNYGITTLINESVTIAGVKFYGTPYQPVFFDWAFNLPPHELLVEYAKIPNDTKILITHTPPFMERDAVARPSGDNVGCPILRDKVLSIKPKAHIFGHIHESYGISSNKDTTFINASCVNLQYKRVNEPIIFILEENI